MLSSIDKRISRGTLLLAGIFVLGLVLRLGGIDAHGYWTDEVSSIETARNGLAFVFTNHFGWVGNQTSWHYALIWLLVQPLDPVASTILVRLPSALAGAFLPLVVYGLGRELFSRTAGLIAAFMVALSPLLLDYSHDLRPYALYAFLTTASVFCLVVAERTGDTRWWLGFVLTTCANLLNTYFAVTLVLPALAPYLAWALWRAWKERRQAGHAHNFLLFALSLIFTGVIAGLMLMEYLRLPGTPVDWSRFSIASLFNMPVHIFASFTSLGVTGQLEAIVSWGLLLLAVIGAYAGVRGGHVRGVALCSFLSLAPSFVLAVVVTTSLVFSRYVLFIEPFYFLLIGNAIAAALQAGKTSEASGFIFRLLRPGGVVFAWVISALFLVGAFNYLNPTTHQSVSYRPDFRGVAAYLSHAGPQDTIILADYPAAGYGVTNFYWHHRPPTQLYDARDPRLFSAPMRGNVYWVFSFLDHQLTSRLAEESGPEQGWVVVANLEGVVVLKEPSSGRNAVDVVERMADKLDALSPGFVPTSLLQGGVLQARGDAEGAARLYREAVSGFWLGDMSLRTAEAFDGLGLNGNAWQEGIISKTMEPYRPEVHRWLERHLQEEGYVDESRVEGEIADLLYNSTAK